MMQSPSSDPELARTIHRFWRAFEQSDLFAIVRTPTTPPEMIVGLSESPDWFRWRLLPCDVDLTSDWARLEEGFGRPLPSAFKSWYASMFTLDIEVAGVVRLPSHPSNDLLGPIRRHLLEPDPFDQNALEFDLIPFGDEVNMDAGPMCFDARDGGDSDRWPIRFWDHEWAGTPQQVSPILFSSFERLLRSCVAYMECERARGGVEAMEALMAADPDGAGGPGRQYWQCQIDTLRAD